MTTIAASSSEGAIAGDTIACDGDFATPVVKIYRSRGCLIGVAGDYYAAHIFLEWFEAGAKKKDRPDHSIGDFSALVLDSDGRLLTCDSRFVFVEETLLDHFAIGSGAAFAMSALDLGLDVRAAVEHAAKFDVYTGGNITIKRISDDD